MHMRQPWARSESGRAVALQGQETRLHMLLAVAGHRGIADAQDAFNQHGAVGVVQEAGASHGGTRRCRDDPYGDSEVGVTDVAIDQAVGYERLGGVRNQDKSCYFWTVESEILVIIAISGRWCQKSL